LEHDHSHMHESRSPGASAGHDRRGREAGGHHARMVDEFRRRFWISLVLTIPVVALSPMIQHFFGLREELRFSGDVILLFILSSAVFFYGGLPFLRGLADEVRKKKPGMMTLVGVAISSAYLYSAAVVFGVPGELFFWEASTLIVIMLLGHWIEMKSVMGASRALEELARLMPAEAHRIFPDGSMKDVPIEELAAGDRVLVRPGEKVPADGAIMEGETSLNESMLTGESVPVQKKTGDAVIGGAINGEGAVTVEIRKTGKDSFLSQIIGLVREAQESKSRTQDIANRAASWLTLVALGGGGLTLAVWILAAGRDFAFSLERAVTVMVISCPHALGLAVPLVVAVSTSISAGKGLLIRNRAAFESARNIRAVVFDKTGTLTEGRFGITDTVVFPGFSEQEVLGYAASVERHSEHPIARGIASASVEVLPVDDFRSITGKGAQGRVEGRDVRVVSPGYLKEMGLEVSDAKLDSLSAQGKTIVYVMVDGKAAAAIALADVIRPESKRAVEALRGMGIRCMMLTGDNRRVAEWVAGEIGLDEFFAEVLPQEKTDRIKEIQSRGLTVAMTGDGVNDAPALAQADVGIAVGAGTDVAVETADIILVRSNPMDVVAVIGLARATYRKMIQNLAWATGYNAVAIPLAAGILYKEGILLSPALGAVLMSLSTVIVAVNAQFIRIKKE